MKQQVEMCVTGTPVEHHPQWGLWVKREDLSCPSGPHFSKTRGVFAHIAERNEEIIGCLDTSHSQGGWATARACQLLGRKSVVFFPVYKSDKVSDGLRHPQQRAAACGAVLTALQAGRSAILYHQAKRWLGNYASGLSRSSYMMPNALKLPETVTQTADEWDRTFNHGTVGTGNWLVSASSGTVAAGLLRALSRHEHDQRLIIHLGYSRSETAVRQYLTRMSGVPEDEQCDIVVIDEGYAYRDQAPASPEPEWPCNAHYDLKAFHWWTVQGRQEYKNAILWNIG